MRAILALGTALLACSTTSLAEGTRVAVDLSRSAGSSEAVVAILTQERYADLAGEGKLTRTQLRSESERARTIEVESDGGGQAAAQADLFELRDQDRPVICVLPSTSSSSRTIYLSLWTRTAGEGPQFSGMEKLFPNDRAGLPKEGHQMASDEVLCVGQPGSGFGLRAKYSEGAQEQIYAHVTGMPDTQPAGDDVLMLGKSVPGARSAPSGYGSGIAVYKVIK